MEQSKIIVWILAVTILSGMRYAHIYYYKYSVNDISNCRTWRYLLYASFSLSGLLWGVSIVYLAPVENLIFLGANSLWIIAIIAGAIGSYSFLNRVYLSFSIFACLPGIVYLLTLQETTYLSISAALCVALIYMAISSNKTK